MNVLCKCQIDLVFNMLLEEQVSRETASSWASRMIENEEQLFYVPSNCEEVIWEVIMFLLGVDLKDSPTSYLHDKADIKNHQNKFEDKYSRINIL